MFWWLANRQVFTHLQVALSTEHLKVDETVIPTMNPCSILSKNIDIYPHLPPTVFLQSAIVSDRVRCLGAPCIAFIHACIRTCFGGIFTFSEEIQGANGFLNPCVWPLLVMSIITLWIPVVESVYWPTTGACPAENRLIYLGALKWFSWSLREIRCFICFSKFKCGFRYFALATIREGWRGLLCEDYKHTGGCKMSEIKS